MTKADELLIWHPHIDTAEYETLEAFHEWNVEFAIAKFKAKRSNNEPVTFFNFRRNLGIGIGEINICETRYGNPHEKYVVQQTMREACHLMRSVTMISSVCEMWIATDTASERKMERYGEVRFIPGREDGLMVATFHRNGTHRMTKWIVKLKSNPAHNRMLARDDINEPDMQFAGANFGFFEAEKQARPLSQFYATVSKKGEANGT